MRAVAAFMVALYHAHLLLIEDRFAPIFNNELYFFAFGKCGVHMFFVLSGFIMVMATSERHYSFRKFISRRFRRIYPVYWISALLCLAAFATLATPLPVSFMQSLGAMLLLPGYAPRIIGAAWTLSFEIYFYICFGLAMMLGLTRGLVVLAAFFLCCVAAGKFIDMQNPVLDQVTSALLLEFLGGAAIGWLAVRSKLPERFGALITAAAIVLFMLGLALGYDKVPDALSFGGPSLLLVLGLVSWECRSGAHPLVELIGKLGNSSYSLYLNHEALIFALLVLLRFAAFPQIPAIPVALAIALICVVFGIAFHLLVENPLLKRLSAQPTLHVTVAI
jgi:exopolysaccharide production protein ExoZ